MSLLKLVNTECNILVITTQIITVEVAEKLLPELRKLNIKKQYILKADKTRTGNREGNYD